ncbi:MAG: hypothetical protein QHH09_03540 [Microgenomates group bacterium]|nr:hypothetical protein [Microgenomates group bacterium]
MDRINILVIILGWITFIHSLNKDFWIFILVFFVSGFCFFITSFFRLKKDWYRKYLMFSNEIHGKETFITPYAIEGKKFGGIVGIIVGLIILLTTLFITILLAHFHYI